MSAPVLSENTQIISALTELQWTSSDGTVVSQYLLVNTKEKEPSTYEKINLEIEKDSHSLLLQDNPTFKNVAIDGLLTPIPQGGYAGGVQYLITLVQVLSSGAKVTSGTLEITSKRKLSTPKMVDVVGLDEKLEIHFDLHSFEGTDHVDSVTAILNDGSEIFYITKPIAAIIRSQTSGLDYDSMIVTSSDDARILNSRDYEVSVFASMDATGDSEISGAALGSPQVVPNAPQNLAIQNGEEHDGDAADKDTFTLTWDHPNDYLEYAGRDVTVTYEVFMKAESESEYSSLFVSSGALSAGQQSFVKADLAINAKYSFQVIYTNDAGAGTPATTEALAHNDVLPPLMNILSEGDAVASFEILSQPPVYSKYGRRVVEVWEKGGNRVGIIVRKSNNIEDYSMYAEHNQLATLQNFTTTHPITNGNLYELKVREEVFSNPEGAYNEKIIEVISDYAVKEFQPFGLPGAPSINTWQARADGNIVAIVDSNLVNTNGAALYGVRLSIVEAANEANIQLTRTLLVSDSDKYDADSGLFSDLFAGNLLQAGTEYHLRVTTITEHPREGLVYGTDYDQSETPVEPADIPSAPFISSIVDHNTAQPDDLQFSFDIAPPFELYGLELQSYRLDISVGGSSIGIISLPADATSFSTVGRLLPLQQGQDHSISLTAVTADSGGNTTDSEVATETISPYVRASAPQNLVLTLGDGKFTVNWDFPLSDGGRGIDNYRIITDADDADKDYLVVGTVTSFVVTGTPSDDPEGGANTVPVVNGQTYNVKVVAITRDSQDGDIVGIESAAETVKPGAAPDAPSNIQVAEGDESATLTFEKPSGNGYDLTAITAELRLVSDNSLVSSHQVLGPLNFLDVPGLTNGLEYRFDMFADNDIGQSATVSSASFRPFGVPSATALITDGAVVNDNKGLRITIARNGRPVTRVVAFSRDASPAASEQFFIDRPISNDSENFTGSRQETLSFSFSGPITRYAFVAITEGGSAVGNNFV